MVDHLQEYNHWMEVSNLLVWRDGIHDALRAGVGISPDHRLMLAAAEDRLISLWKELVRRFPDVFADRAPLEYWWWHLDKGPQVREEAERAA